MHAIGKPNLRMRRSGIVVLVVGLMLATAGVGTSSASTTALPGFAAQSQAAGLSVDQAKVLQGRVDDYLARTGGTQVAANEIRLPGNATLTLALPGEIRARSLTAPRSQLSSPYCMDLYFCAWSGQYWTGDRIDTYYCNTRYSMPWSGYGSYANWQTTGLRARFLDASLQTIEYSLPAFVNRNSYPWTPVYWIIPC